MSQLSKNDKKDLKNGLKEQKKAASNRFKEGLSNYQGINAKQVRLNAKQEFRNSVSSLKITKSDLEKKKEFLRAIEKTGKPLSKKDIEEYKKKYKAYHKAKLDVEISKKLHQKAKKSDPTLVRNQMRQESKIRMKQEANRILTSNLRENDSIGEGIDKIQRASHLKMNMRRTLKVTKDSAALSRKVMKKTYGLSNRSYNLVRGKGFYRTPNQFTTRNQLLKKARQYNRRMKAYRLAKQQRLSFNIARLSSKIQQSIAQFVKIIVGNPLIWIVLLAVLVITIILSAISGNTQFAILQEESDLTDSWLYMTKIDAEHNDESNTFYTDLDNVMFYMNHEYEDYKVEDYMNLSKTYGDQLKVLWEDLNGKSPNYETKTMDNLLTDQKSKYFMKEDDYSDYQEAIKEYGYQTLDDLLAFPYKTDQLTVTRRFGYEGKKDTIKLFEGIEVSTIVDTEIYAPMKGKVKVLSSTSVEILMENTAKLIIEGISTNRFKGGEEVQEGEYIGIAEKESMTIKYYKQQAESKDESWKLVNPAFYFPKVVYSQQTVLGTDYEAGSLSPEITKLIPLFKKAMKEVGMPEKYLPIVLAVAMQESGGRVADVMQSSESLGLPPNTLGTEASILQGVKYLWGNIQLVGVERVDQDEKYLKTAVQAYNYGSGFIAFSKINNYAYTQEMATTYSFSMSGGTGLYGDAKYVPHVWRYMLSSKPGNGQFAYPLSERIEVVSGFDWRINPVTGIPELHKGLDFAAPAGTPVFASEDAIVMRSSDVGDGYGINVVLKHTKGGYWTRYAHLSRAAVTNGSTVQRGQLIGYIGSTGQSTGPHLHYEVMTDLYSGHVDPRSFIN